MLFFIVIVEVIIMTNGTMAFSGRDISSKDTFTTNCTTSSNSSNGSTSSDSSTSSTSSDSSNCITCSDSGNCSTSSCSSSKVEYFTATFLYKSST